jgi:DNA-binding transcriptional regulator YhcF (GntR family)
MPGLVDPYDRTPVYLQLADIIREDIAAGHLSPGRMLPSEARLAQVHGIGRDAVRDALAELRSEGLIVTESGVGSSVREQVEREVVRLKPGDQAWPRMPTPAERRRLRILEGTPVIVVERGDEQTVYVGDRTLLVPE